MIEITDESVLFIHIFVNIITAIKEKRIIETQYSVLEFNKNMDQFHKNLLVLKYKKSLVNRLFRY